VNKISVIITGQIKSPVTFSQSINEFILLQKEGIVDEIILSTWGCELEKIDSDFLNYLRKYVVIVTPEPPKINSGSAFYQMKSFHFGLNKIKDQDSFIFKSRPDLFISKDDLKEIILKNYEVTSLHSPFNSKVWVPWFEISKPFYLADECFFCSFSDAVKLYNYDTVFDNYYNIDAGISHIRRFYNPFIALYPEFDYFFQYFGRTGHGTVARFTVFDLLCKNKNYRKGVSLYYKILHDNFNIGLNKNGYILFREWNEEGNKSEITSLNASIYAGNSFDSTKGQVYAYTDHDLKNLIDNMPFDPDSKIIASEQDILTSHSISQIINSIPKTSFFKKLSNKILSYV